MNQIYILDSNSDTKPEHVRRDVDMTVQDSNSDTKPEHVRRDVDITVESIPLGAGVNAF